MTASCEVLGGGVVCRVPCMRLKTLDITGSSHVPGITGVTQRLQGMKSKSPLLPCAVCQH